MKILVTGGAGYLGTELVRELAEKEETQEIIVYDNLSRGNFNLFLGLRKLNSKVRFVKADILDSRTFRQAIKGVDVVYHLAAKVTTQFAEHHAHLFEQVNHWGTAEIVYSVEKSDVSKFIFLSSASVYGPSETELDETTNPRPKSIYGRSKFNAEKQVMRLGEKMDAYIIRCANIYGYSPSMRFDGVINKFVFESNFRRRISIDGDGQQFRSFVPIDLATSAVAKIPFSDIRPGCYNLVKSNLTVNEIADTLNEIFPDLERVYINQDLQLNQLKAKPNESFNRLANVDELGFVEFLSSFASQFTF